MTQQLAGSPINGYMMASDMTQESMIFARKNGPLGTNWSPSYIVAGMTEMADNTVYVENQSLSDLPALVKAVQRQNRDAFEALYDATIQRVFSVALRITRQQEMAEEVVSDVYLQVWQKADSYSQERGKVIAWLCVLCRSRALDALRRDNAGVRQASVSMDSAPEAEDPCEPVDLLLSAERGSALHTAIGTLSEQQRQLMALAYFRGYTHSELAVFLDLPIGTVKTQLHRAMNRLKEIMAPDSGNNGGSNE